MPRQSSCHSILFCLTGVVFSLFVTVAPAWALYPVAAYTNASSFRDIEVVGQRAYVADGSEGLVIFDVSDPRQPVVLGTFDTPGYALGVAVVGNLVYVADYRSGLRIIDVSNPAAPIAVGSQVISGESYAVVVEGGRAYLADLANGLRVIDIAAPASPSLIGSYILPGCVPASRTDARSIR